METNIFKKARSHFDNGIKFYNNSEYELAEKEFIKSLQLVPDRLSTISNLIKIYIKNEEKIKLEDFLKKFNNLKNEKEILFGLAYKEYFNSKYKDSIDICNILLNFKEIELEVLDLLASNYKKTKNFLVALKIYKIILQKNRNHFETYYNIGELLFELGKIKQAYFFFKKSYNFNKSNIATLWNMSLCALTLKDFNNGFLLYETRWRRKNFQIKKFTHIKLANNINDIYNKKILIWDEQGLGDTIQFSRFVICLLKYTNDITFVVNKRLKDLFSYLDSRIKVLDYESLNQAIFDYQLPICSLPNLLKISNIKEIPYYKLDLPKRVGKVDVINKNKLNIGLAWSGNPNYPNDEYRSIPLKNFYNLLSYKNVNFYKLFKDLRVSELFDFNSYNIKDFGEKKFLDLSYVIKELDLVISADTSIIHLCGILGVNSILLLNFNSDWRWFDDDKTTIWYPSVKIIKQKKFNNWEYVFDQLNDEIKIIHKKI